MCLRARLWGREREREREVELRERESFVFLFSFSSKRFARPQGGAARREVFWKRAFRGLFLACSFLSKSPRAAGGLLLSSFFLCLREFVFFLSLSVNQEKAESKKKK